MAPSSLSSSHRILRWAAAKFSWQALLLVLLVCAIGFPSLSMPWSLIDDGTSLQVAQLIAQGDWGLPFTVSRAEGRFIPGYWLLHWLRYELFGLLPFAWHLSQICMFLIIVLLVFGIAQDLTGSRNGALLSGLLFVLLGSIENLYRLGTQEVLLAVCLAGSLHSLLKSHQHLERHADRKAALYLIPALVVLSLGYLTKETSLVLVPVSACMFCLAHVGEKSIRHFSWAKTTGIYFAANLGLAAGIRGAAYLLRIKGGQSSYYQIAVPRILTGLRVHLDMLFLNGGFLLVIVFTSFLVRLACQVYEERRLSLGLKWQIVMLVWFISGLAMQSPWYVALWRYLLPYWVGGSIFLGIELYEISKLLRDTLRKGWLFVQPYDQTPGVTQSIELHHKTSWSPIQTAQQMARHIISHLKDRKLYLLLLLSSLCLLFSFEAGISALAPYEINIGDVDDEKYVRDFHQREANEWSSFRWTKARSYVTLAQAGHIPMTISLAINGWRPEGQPPPQLVLLANGRQIASFVAEKESKTYQFRYIPPLLPLSRDLVLQLDADTFTPPSDEAQRTLGVLVDSVVAAPITGLLWSSYLLLVALLSAAIGTSYLLLRSLLPAARGSFVGTLVMLAVASFLIAIAPQQAFTLFLSFAVFCALCYASLVVVRILGYGKTLSRAIILVLAGSVAIHVLLRTESLAFVRPLLYLTLPTVVAFSILTQVRESSSQGSLEPYAHACLLWALALTSLGFIYANSMRIYNFAVNMIERDTANAEMVTFLAHEVAYGGHVFFNLSADPNAYEWYYETGLHLDLFYDRGDIKLDFVDLESEQAYKEGDILLTWSRFRRYPIEELLTRFPSRIVEEKLILRTYPQVTRDPLMVTHALRSFLMFGDTLPVVSIHDYEWRIYRIGAPTERSGLGEARWEAMGF